LLQQVHPHHPLPKNCMKMKTKRRCFGGRASQLVALAATCCTLGVMALFVGMGCGMANSYCGFPRCTNYMIQMHWILEPALFGHCLPLHMGKHCCWHQCPVAVQAAVA